MSIQLDPLLIKKAMVEGNKLLDHKRNSSAVARQKEAKRRLKQEQLASYTPSELLGRKFNKIIQSLPMKERDDWFCCFFCGDELTVENPNHADHIYPFSKGGVIVVPACLTCNRQKGCMLLERYRAHFYGVDHVFWGESVIARGIEGLRARAIQEIETATA